MNDLRIRRIAALLAIATGVASCRESMPLMEPAQQPAPALLQARVLVERTGSSALVTLAMDAPGGSAKIGSFTGSLAFDPSVLAYVEEAPIDDGVLRAANPGHGLVRVAGASTSGIASARLAAFRFVVLDNTRPPGLRFDIAELHQTTRGDMLPQMMRAPVEATP